MAEFNKIAFPVSSEIYDVYSVLEPDLFEAPNLFTLFLQPENYQPIYNELAESGTTPSFTSLVVLDPVVQYGIQVTLPDARAIVYDILKLIRDGARQPSGYQAITVLDFHSLDSAEARSLGYTTRQCAMLGLQRTSGSLRVSAADTSPRIAIGGVQFRLLELT